MSVRAQVEHALPLADRPFSLVVSDVYTVGSAAARSGWEMFSSVDRVAFGPDGTLYVLDQRGRKVQGVLPDGRQGIRIGRPGQGPGEFALPSQLAVMPDGRVAVWDGSNRALTLFTPKGDVDVSRTLRGRDVPRPAEGFYAVGPDRLAFMPSRLRLGALTGSRDETDRGPGRASIYVVDLSSRAPEAVTEVARQAQILKRAADGALLTVEPPAFSFETLWSPLPGGGFAVVDSDAYRVRLLDPEGREWAVIRRAVVRVIVTERDREEWRIRLADEVRSAPVIRMGGGSSSGSAPDPDTEELIERRLANTTYADTAAALLGMRVDGEGRIWLQRTGERPGQPGPVDLVTVEGRYLGTVPAEELLQRRLPDALGPDGLGAWITTGVLDVPGVEVRRLLAGSRSPDPPARDSGTPGAGRPASAGR